MFEVLGNYNNRGIGFIWYCHERKGGEGLTITFNSSTINKRDALETIKNKLQEAKEDWIRPIKSPVQEWEIDLDKIKEKNEKAFDELKNVAWLTGKIKNIPELEFKQEADIQIKLSINFVIKPDELNT